MPELKNFPTRYIYEPWNAPEKDQDEAACTIGTDYPAPFGGNDGLFMYEGEPWPTQGHLSDNTRLIIGRQNKER